MKVLKVKSGIIRNRILVEATCDKSCTFGSFLGGRKWTLNKGSRVTLLVPKSDLISVGDLLDFSYCVRRDWRAIGGHKIPWRWHY